MSKMRQFMNSYYKVYILAICILWLLVFFLPWGFQIGGVSVYFFIMKKLFVVFGVLAIFFSVLTKKMSLFLFGVLFCMAFWINLFLYFGLLPAFLGN
ncbi:hypothetical protein D8802_02250 [Streptococcus oralis]|uniref:SpeK n=1 Tax=Streptococcus oralis TaxID=1303 RepID=A0A3R9KAM1_STROR|nr:hypothetical protein [Streptococcus oralis]RSJ68649.1 hypothetical protein D8802_02250 [Streptococcus oralis]